MNHSKIFGILILIFLHTFSFAQTNIGDTLWAKSTTSGSASEFHNVATDSEGNYYAVGYIYGTGTFDFGNGATVNGPNTNKNIILVKYDANGNAVSANSFITGTNFSELKSVSTDNNGNVYVAGSIYGGGIFYLGNAVNIAGSASSASNIFLAKYDSSGKPLWTRSTVSGTDTGAKLEDIVVDCNDDVYAVGYAEAGTYDFGEGVTTTIGGSVSNIILIKYDTNGSAKWVRTAGGTGDQSKLEGVALDNTGNPHVGGYIVGPATFDFGNNITVTPPNASANVLVAKYNSTGYAQWAKTATSAPGGSKVYSIAVDNSGNTFASGHIENGTFGFGNGVNTTGVSSGRNGLLLKYNNAGEAQWGKSPTVAPNDSEFYGVGADYQGNAYVGGYIIDTGEYNFGNNVTAKGSHSSFNLVLVNYDSKGDPIMARSVVSGDRNSEAYGLAIDPASLRDVAVAGFLYGNGIFDLGNNITVSGYASGKNPVIINYRGDYVIPESSSSISSNSTSSNSTSSSSKQPAASSSSSSNPAVVSDAATIKLRLPKLFAIAGGVLLLF